jgi:hypothetical protein
MFQHHHLVPLGRLPLDFEPHEVCAGRHPVPANAGEAAPRLHCAAAHRNAWAPDAYVKASWRDAPLTDLAPQVAMLLAFAAAFLVVARLLARRWDSA